MLLVVAMGTYIIVVFVSGTCYLVCGGIRMYTCFSQDDHWYLVSRQFNMTKLLDTALNTSREGWRCF